jgi:hypothetical protein
MARFLTGADIVIMLQASIAGSPVFPAAFQLQGFAADDVFSSDAIEPAEVYMGVDGNLSAGFTYKPVPQAFMLQSDSFSIDNIEQVQQIQQQAGTIAQWSATMTLSAVQKVYTSPKGFMTGYSSIPEVKKLIQPRRFTLTWERMFAAVTA